jgi:hypothetical protein
MDKTKIQKNLNYGKALTLYDDDELRYVQKPIGKAIYKNAIGRPKKKEEDKAHPNDRLICDVCGNKFIRAHRSKHKKTKVHQAYEKMNKKIQKLLIEEDSD